MKTLNKIHFYNISDFEGGWFIGNFSPSLLKTSDFEVSVKEHPKGQFWPTHYHKLATEYNCVILGKVKIGKKIFQKDDIFVVPPSVLVNPEFLENTVIVCIKTPSCKDDKYIVESD